MPSVLHPLILHGRDFHYSIDIDRCFLEEPGHRPGPEGHTWVRVQALSAIIVSGSQASILKQECLKSQHTISR